MEVKYEEKLEFLIKRFEFWLNEAFDATSAWNRALHDYAIESTQHATQETTTEDNP
jgi:hypothetical protein